MAKTVSISLSASIRRILVFRDRIEIISLGHLPDNITTDEIKLGKTLLA